MAYKAFDLTGKVSLVTGGNSGIGLGMAEALAQAGAGVCIWGTNADKNAAALKHLAQFGTKVHAIRCDVADEAAVEKSFAETVKVMGHVDNCVANAGTSGKGAAPLYEMPTAEWRRMMSVNLDGAFFTIRAAARHMVERGKGGSIVAMASSAAIEGAARNAHYGATKGALCSMIRAVAVELARHRITANSILPGWIETPMTERLFKDNKPFVEKVLPRVPARRGGVGADFGPLAVYLASDATNYTTGQNFVVDGGYTIF
ncbi:MAG: SDR family NAD(P)-dependent oxidoreductase [Reyranellaceae bacterium]